MRGGGDDDERASIRRGVALELPLGGRGVIGLAEAQGAVLAGAQVAAVGALDAEPRGLAQLQVEAAGRDVRVDGHALAVGLPVLAVLTWMREHIRGLTDRSL